MFKRPQPFTYVLLAAAVGGVLGYCAQVLATVSALPLVTPLWGHGVLVLMIAAVVLVLAWQVRGESRRYGAVANPFRAVRVLLAARAAALLAGLSAGFAGGSLLWVLLRLTVLPLSVWGPQLFLLVAAVAAAGLSFVAERWCMIPPDDSDDAAVSGAEPAMG